MKTQHISDTLIYFLATNRRHFPVQQIAWLAKKIVHGCENYSYNFKLNGEEVLLRRLQKAGLSVFFDVGANRGEWTTIVRQYFSTASIHCFEIAPAMHPILDESLRQLFPPPVVNHFGLSNRTGMTKFNFCSEEDGLSSLLPERKLAGSVEIDVQVLTGDSYVEQHSIRSIDFLKLDVEGAENLVLEGFSETLRRAAIKIIQFEYGKANIDAGFLLRDFYQLLEPLGYSIGKIFPDAVEFKPYLSVDENFIGPNFLAVHQSENDLIRLLRP